MKTRNLAVALGLTLAMSVAVAGGKYDKRECSPGWYKNNGLDTWIDLCDPSDCTRLLAMLNADGNDGYSEPPGVIKNRAADEIVREYIGFGNETCEEAY